MIYLGQNAIGINHTLPIIGQAALLESGTYTPQEDIRAIEVNIPHSLGVVPDFIVVMADTFSAETTMTSPYIGISFWCKSNLIYSNRSSTDGYMFELATVQNNTTAIPRYWPNNSFGNTETFTFPRYNAGWMLKGGITYHYVIGKFKEQEVTTNANE